MSGAEARAALTRLGKRRKKQESDEETLRDEVRALVAAAKVADPPVPMNEVAERLQINRTTLYQVYLERPKPSRRQRRRAAAA